MRSLAVTVPGHTESCERGGDGRGAGWTLATPRCRRETLSGPPCGFAGSAGGAGRAQPEAGCALEIASPLSCCPLEALARAQNLYFFLFLLLNNGQSASVTLTL